jgi:predicted transcriptional regulator of viral defense system
MEERGVLDRVAHGLYRFPSIPPTGLEEFIQATLWPRGRGVISHESALDLHELCDVNPAKIHVTIPTSYRLRRRAPSAYVFHRRELADEDRTLHEGIPIVTPRRAILDGIEAGLRDGLIDQAIKTAQARGLIRTSDLALLDQSRRAAKRSA